MISNVQKKEEIKKLFWAHRQNDVIWTHSFKGAEKLSWHTNNSHHW